MICEIVKGEAIFAQKAEPATICDLSVAEDLLETLCANREICVGMAANMIGVNKRIIIFDNDGNHEVMFNPQIIKQSEPYTAEEGCLSLIGTRKTKRFKSIKVQYQNSEFQTRIKTYKGFTAQIIQHEIDHCDGIVI
ncbi:Peptide deformylase [bioreactor metagenome]|uniref:Peptide deformylase n=1 Tax=bioreactor metagenome TaxID=1076179 RepID=A0A644ZYQ5_9ZZZZ